RDDISDALLLATVGSAEGVLPARVSVAAKTAARRPRRVALSRARGGERGAATLARRLATVGETAAASALRSTAARGRGEPVAAAAVATVRGIAADGAALAARAGTPEVDAPPLPRWASAARPGCGRADPAACAGESALGLRDSQRCQRRQRRCNAPARARRAAGAAA